MVNSVLLSLRYCISAAAKHETVMISYQPRSKLAALKIAHRLKAAGFDVWIDIENKCT